MGQNFDRIFVKSEIDRVVSRIADLLSSSCVEVPKDIAKYLSLKLSGRIKDACIARERVDWNDFSCPPKCLSIVSSIVGCDVATTLDAWKFEDESRQVYFPEIQMFLPSDLIEKFETISGLRVRVESAPVDWITGMSRTFQGESSFLRQAIGEVPVFTLRDHSYDDCF